MTNICNKLDKLNPPSFVTTATAQKRSVVQKWSLLVVQSKYKVMSLSLSSEINILTGFIERKGTQLRLEKALMLTKQIQKLVQRWRTNDFYPQLIQFQKSIGDFDEGTGYLKSGLACGSGFGKKDRLPSTQWSNWVIYLALRDSALLAKISIECENTIKFWFGLIASGHHWGDSLVICGVLARTWYLASKLVEDFIQVIYPCLFNVSNLLQPNKSPTWPDPNFSPPSNLQDWICNSMKLPFCPIDPIRDFKFTPMRQKMKPGADNLSFLKNYFLPGGKSYHKEVSLNADETEEADEADADPMQLEQDHQVITTEAMSTTMDCEDIGIAVDIVDEPPKKKTKQKKAPKKKGKKKNNVENRVQDVEALAEESCALISSTSTSSWKEMKTRWRKFFLNVNNKIESCEGQKKLVIRINKYSKTETDTKLKIKLKKLKKLVVRCKSQEGAKIGALTGFSNFQTFVNKYVTKLKKQQKNNKNK